MHAFPLRALVVLFVLGSLVFAPASERVSEAAPGNPTGLSTLVLLPTVESAVGIDDETSTLFEPSLVTPLDGRIVAVAVALVSLLCLLAPSVVGRGGRLARPLGQRAPPSVP